MSASIPTATYRLQFHKDFTFRAARELVPYLDALGISHVYASPIFQASPGSPHGYDICDHNRLNSELGSREDFEALAAELKARGMGLIADFVPNHMGISEAANGWWMDVLENGPSSPFARYFDVDWQPVKRELEHKVLLPILGDQYGRVLERGELKLAFSEGAFRLEYFGRVLPVAPRTIRPLLDQACEKLRARGEPLPAELESIIFALAHLPERTETEPTRIVERAREKEIVKLRLARLCAESPAVQRAIDEVIAELQSGGAGRDFDAFDRLISAQPYRLAYWRVAAEEINYRRFFDVNNLAAIRMEVPEVFDATHRLIFELIAAGSVSGLRIDHVDGLFDPRAYLTQLQERAGTLLGATGDDLPLYLLVEKILGPNESLRGDWPIHGTTGYEFVAQVTNVLIDTAAGRAFTDAYATFLGFALSYPEVAYRTKLLTMHVAMASEVNVLGHMLNRISETNRWYRDFTLNALTTAIREVIACFPVYRTYLAPPEEPAADDVQIIQRAIAAARRRNPAVERTVFEFLRDVLLPPASNAHPVDEDARRQFVKKFQQCTGPITAKGVEDTAFYVFNRLVALNEVGGEPTEFGTTVAEFHQHLGERMHLPHSMAATSTHDTKRSEDVRARIAALSEMPQEWARVIRRWHTANRKHRAQIDGEPAPDPNEEYLLYQTLLGSWPLAPMSDEEHAGYVRRIQEYMRKALHEAKVNSSWIEPNEAWDSAVEDFVAKILSTRRRNRFMESFEAMAQHVAELGAMNSLSQVVLKLTAPGVPDFYQGQELWDFSLVDPDNRRPVDYALRRERLASLAGAQPAELLEHWRDGRIKLFITQKLIQFRRTNPQLFATGDYTPLEVEGELAQCCIAFRRGSPADGIIVVVPRLTSRVGFPPTGEKWRDTRLSGEFPGDRRDVLTGEPFSACLSEALRTLPCAVLARE